MINPSIYSDEECDLQVTTGTGSSKQKYTGTQSSTRTLALIFSQATQTFTLDTIDTSFSFPLEQSAHTSRPAGSQDPDSLRNALIQEEGSPDQENPYDWRHQLNRQTTDTPSPTPEPFDPLNLDSLGTPSPEARPVKAKSFGRKASTPPGSSPASSPAASPVQSPAPSQPASQAPSLNDLPTPPAGLEFAEDEEEEEEEEDEDDAGGLEIDWGGGPKPQSHFRGRFNNKIEGAPISLRSAASSRSPAPGGVASSDESDEDVEKMDLGSPIRSKPAQDPDLDIEMNDAAEEEEDDFEAAFQEALEESGDGGEEDTSYVAPQHQQVYDESSDESVED